MAVFSKATTKAPIEKAAPLLTALKELLEKTPGINNIRWSNDYDT
jgi:hypothetical protein